MAADTPPATRRRRRSADEARAEILAAATRLLVDGGPDAVRVQVVAREVGMTDAAVHYHFGNRDALLDEVMRQAGRQLRDDLTAATATPGGTDVRTLLAALDDAFAGHGRDHARLLAWMRLAGRRPEGSAMLRPAAEVLHEARRRRAEEDGTPPPPLDDTLHLVVLLSLVAWADALVGEEARRSVDLPATRAAGDDLRAWLVDRLDPHRPT